MTNGQTQWLLMAGIAAALLFFAVATVEVFARPGFSIIRHAISMLSLGERGWVMVATFIASGVLVLLCATGIWQATGHLFGAVLVGLFGAGLIVAGFFPAPAGLGFPPGTPADMAPVMDTGAVLHSVGFMLAFGSLIVGCFVFSAHFWMGGQVALGVFSLLAGLAIPLLIGLGMASVVATGVAFYVAAMLAWLWLAIIAWRAMPAVALAGA
ncbi:MAG: DUF998 domain-containing protein [Hyphomicrobiales bacterium]|nr:MAG: DUF998 domain-containing protein [Hyphomicrobiales bacterium]